MIRRNYIIDGQKPASATDAQVALAEELIDQYVGYQPRFIQGEYHGRVSTDTGNVITDVNNNTQLNTNDNYYSRGIIEIIGGTGAGAIRTIASSSRSGKSVAYDGASIGADTTSIFRIYQLAKFPRLKDSYATPDTAVFYKQIPNAVQEAVIAQVDFILEMGDDYFIGEDAEMNSESLGKYSYSRGNSDGQSALVKMIAPKSRTILRGIKNSTGRLLAEDPTCP